MSLPIAAADLTFACDNVSANHSKGQYSATLLCANVNTYLIPVHPWAVQYMLNDVLCNLRDICKRINSICVRPLCVLENGVCQNVTPDVIVVYFFFILGHVLNTFYLPVLVPLGVTGNILSFLVRI